MPKNGDKKQRWSLSRLFRSNHQSELAEPTREPAEVHLGEQEVPDLDFEIIEELEPTREIKKEVANESLDFYVMDDYEGERAMDYAGEITGGPLDIDIDTITEGLHIQDEFADEAETSIKHRPKRTMERTELDDLLDGLFEELEKSSPAKPKVAMSFNDLQEEEKKESGFKREKPDFSKMPSTKQKTAEKTDKKEINPRTKK